jgi:PAS domain-containing protein
VSAGSIEGMFGAAYWHRHAPLDRRVLETGRTLAPFEEDLPDSFGQVRVFLTTKTPLLADDGRIDAVITVSVDITDRKDSVMPPSCI